MTLRGAEFIGNYDCPVETTEIEFPINKKTTAASLAATLPSAWSQGGATGKQPNILYIFSDQWRECDHGYTGNPDVITPNIDRFARQSVNFTHAVAGIPVCCPHRATLITGKYPLTHGLYLNDLSLTPEHRSIAHCLNDAGYKTGWIGKWHIDGQGREEFTPPERRQGFQYWRTLECTHNYNHSPYFGDTPETKYWEGYDAIAQTQDAQGYLERAYALAHEHTDVNVCPTGTAGLAGLLTEPAPAHDHAVVLFTGVDR